MSDVSRKLNALLTVREKRSFALLIAAILAMAFLEVAGIAAIMPFMQIVSAPETVQSNRWLSAVYEWMDFDSVRSFMLFVGGLVLGVMTLSKIAGAWTKWMQHRFVWLTAHSLSTRLLTRYLQQPYEFYLTHAPTTLQKQVVGEVKQLVREVLLPLVRLIAQGIVAVVIFILLIIVDPVLALTVLGTLGGAYAVIYFTVRRYLSKLGSRRFILFRQSFKAVAETFGVVKTIKVHRSERHFIERFRVIDREQSRIQPKYAVIAETPQILIELLAFGGILVILLYLLATEQNMRTVIPMLSLYAVAGHRLIPSLQQAFNALAMLRFNHSVLDSIHEDLTQIGALPLLNGVSIEGRHRGIRSIELRDVSYSYPSSEEVILKNINLNIKPGSRIAFVGSTGSGKSTLADIILGLLPPTTGEVIVDGVPLTAEKVRAWLGMIGYVPQEVILTDDSIVRNIAFGLDQDQIDMELVRSVSAVACILDFVEQDLPDGFDTRVGERGIRLSGGQRQRIGLARALYHGPQVLVLDEATSSLDGVTEDSVMNALSQLKRRMTVITIAHRIATVEGCDKIYLLDNGRIVEAGSYEDLMETSTAFRGLARVAL
ncbi:MAG: ABC transporter ATP-binding protein [Rhodothermales bacterium]